MFRRKKKDIASPSATAFPEKAEKNALPESEWRNFIDALFLGVFGRMPDEAGAKHFMGRLAEGASATDLINDLMQSIEYARTRSYFAAFDRFEFQDLQTSDYEATSIQLEQGGVVTAPIFDQAWARLPEKPGYELPGQAEYCDQHQRRFQALSSGLSLLAARFQNPRVLEVGPSAFSNLYKELVPQIRLEILERPTAADYPGFTRERCEQIAGCEKVHCADLNEPKDLKIEGEQFHLVLCAEVLSVLRANPADVITSLMGLLVPGGYLVLTTKNFFAEPNRDRLRRGLNPSAIYPEGDGNWDSHHLYRDFSARELCQIAEKMGVQIAGFCFSPCLDSPDEVAKIRPDQRRNMILVLKKEDVRRDEVEDQDREIVIHIGSDKAGSTAIQSHLYNNRQWLQVHGAHVPTTGLGKDNGHAELFGDLSSGNLRALVDEIRDKGRYQQKIVLSWEGAHFLKKKQIKKLAKALSPWKVRIVYYLREQADVMQSGLLQQIKSQKKPVSIPAIDTEVVPRKSRDYHRTLKRWQAVFPELTCEAVYFDRGDFPNGDVVFDFLRRLGCDPDEGFRVVEGDINHSLDVPSALALTRQLESSDMDAKSIRSLVDTLLLQIKLHGSGQKHFLSEQQVAELRVHYAESNRQLIEEFGLSDKLVSAPPLVSVDSNSTGSGRLEQQVEEVLARANDLQNYPALFGDMQRGTELGQYLGDGWDDLQSGGIRSNSESSQLRLRPFLQALPSHDWVHIRLAGRYAQGMSSVTEVFVNGESMGALNLENQLIVFWVGMLPHDLHIDIELKHGAGACYTLTGLSLVLQENQFGAMWDD
jgi:hypothetical protein